MPRKKDPVRVASGIYATAKRWNPNNTVRLGELRRNVEVEKVIRAVGDLLDEAPPPTVEQRKFIADLILGGES